jgi:hypothetical protein
MVHRLERLVSSGIGGFIGQPVGGIVGKERMKEPNFVELEPEKVLL